MDVDGIIRICDLLGLGYSHPREGDGDPDGRGPQISISCPLAYLRHNNKFDSNNGCSVKIVDNGPSLVKCFSGACRFKGTWFKLLQTALEPKMTPEYQELLEDVAKIEQMTLQARVERNYRIIEKMSQEKIIEEYDKDIIQESKLDRLSKTISTYALSRGINPFTFNRWDLRYDEFLKRLVFLIRRRDKKLVGLQGRDVTGESERPHHNYEGFNRQKYLLGANLLEDGKPVIIVEGSVATIKTDQAMWPTACTLGTLGEGFSKWHAEIIAEANPPCVYICSDGDAPGHAIASKIEYMLHGRFPMRLMECPTDVAPNGKKLWDTGNLPPEHIQFMYRTATPILDRIKWSIPLHGEHPVTNDWMSRRFCNECIACVTQDVTSFCIPT